MKKFIAVFIFLSITRASQAQCAMCKASVESNGGEDLATGLNSGILYLMFVPYLLIGGIAFFMYRHRKKLKQSKGA